MSASDHNGQNGGLPRREGAPDDMRDLLKQLATQITGQIADVDRRNSEAIRNMEQRLQAPAPAPTPARPLAATHAPAATSHHQPTEAYEPWDAASAEALTRLYEADGDDVSAAPPAPAVFFSDPPMTTAPVKPQQIAVVPRAPAEPVRVAAPTPRAPHVEPAAPKSTPTVDHAPPTPPITALKIVEAPVETPATLVAPAPPAPSAEVLAALASDRAWLDERLSDLVARVDQSLGNFDPAAHQAAVSERIDHLEQHIEAALESVVRKPDLERFAGLEQDVAAVKQQVEAARTQLKRLDGIESHLRDLHAFAEQSQADMSGAAALAPAEPVELPDFNRLASDAAHKAADRAAEHFVAVQKQMQQQAKPASVEGLHEMQTLLAGYVAEHRREQGQTATMLNTMQEALIRLIDRIEELAGEAPVADEEPHVEDAPRFVEVPDERQPVGGRRASDQHVPVPPAAHMQAPQPPQQQQYAEPPRREPMPARAGRRVEAAPAPEIDDAAAAAEAMAAERARVAAERAASQPPRRQPTRPVMTVAPDGDIDAAPESAPAAAPEAAARPKRAAASKGAPSTAAKRGLMVAGLGLVLIGSGFAVHTLLANKMTASAKSGERIPPIAVESSVGAAQRPAQATVPQLPQPSQAAQPLAIQPRTEQASPRPTPALPEAQGGNIEQRPQPASQRDVPVTQPAPRQAPAPADGALPRTRPVPETVTDDLSFNTQQPDPNRPNFAEVMGARVSHAAVQGIAIDGMNKMPDASELARRQARLTPPDPAAQSAAEHQATPISAQTEQTGDPLAGETMNGRQRAIEMPPMQIGPQSLRLAAQQGDAAAEFEVAARFAEAKGVKQDFQQAMIWYTRSAQRGFIPAQYRLATLYERGLAGTADLPRAKVWYKRAADQGNIKAMHNLAVLSAGPQQENPDYLTAAKWFAEAADRGLPDSQFNLGVLHENGLGVAKDQTQAYKWFALAARSGDKEATRRRDQLFASFTPGVAQAAEKIVTAWRAKPTDLKANDPNAAAQAMRTQQDSMRQAMMQQQAQAQERQQQQQAAQPAVPAQVAPVVAKEPIAKVIKSAVRPAPKPAP